MKFITAPTLALFSATTTLSKYIDLRNDDFYLKDDVGSEFRNTEPKDSTSGISTSDELSISCSAEFTEIKSCFDEMDICTDSTCVSSDVSDANAMKDCCPSCSDIIDIFSICVTGNINLLDVSVNESIEVEPFSEEFCNDKNQIEKFAEILVSEGLNVNGPHPECAKSANVLYICEQCNESCVESNVFPSCLGAEVFYNTHSCDACAEEETAHLNCLCSDGDFVDLAICKDEKKFEEYVKDLSSANSLPGVEVNECKNNAFAVHVCYECNIDQCENCLIQQGQEEPGEPDCQRLREIFEDCCDICNEREIDLLECVCPTTKSTDGPSLGLPPGPTPKPTNGATFEPTPGPTPKLTNGPTPGPAPESTLLPTLETTQKPTLEPTPKPTLGPTAGQKELEYPTIYPTVTLSETQSRSPIVQPSEHPTIDPTVTPSNPPSKFSSVPPSYEYPTIDPSISPSDSPSGFPSVRPSKKPLTIPTKPGLAPVKIPFPQIINNLITVDEGLCGDNTPMKTSLEEFVTTAALVDGESSTECALDAAALAICIKCNKCDNCNEKMAQLKKGQKGSCDEERELFRYCGCDACEEKEKAMFNCHCSSSNSSTESLSFWIILSAIPLMISLTI